MAADSTGKASPGSPFRPPPATIWNNMIDAGRAFAESQLSSGAPQPTRARGTDLLRLRNVCGSDRRKGEILRIDGAAVSEITDEHIWLNGNVVTEDCRFAVLKEPASAADVVTAQASGICTALVEIADAGHTWASAFDGNYVLQSGDTGQVEILYSPGGTGERECVIRFFRRSTSGALTGGGCGSCTAPPEEAVFDVDLGDDLMASRDYRFAPFCLDWVIFRFTHSTGGTWVGVADTEEVECEPGGTPLVFTATLSVSGNAPGEVTATVSDGTSDWEFTNEAAWQPDQPIELVLKSGPATCPCAPFRSEACLVPIIPAEEEEP